MINIKQLHEKRDGDYTATWKTEGRGLLKVRAKPRKDAILHICFENAAQGQQFGGGK